jgi:hypothetical protein
MTLPRSDEADANTRFSKRPILCTTLAIWRVTMDGRFRGEHGLFKLFSADGRSSNHQTAQGDHAKKCRLDNMIIDATIVRAHQHSAGARKKTASKQSADPYKT